MPTPVYPARNSGDQSVNYLRAPFTFTIGNTGIVQVGTLPANCVIVRAYIVVKTGFNAGTNNFIKVGITGSDASIITTATITTAGLIPGTSPLATSTTINPSVDTPVIATSLMTGTVATAGAGIVVVEYLPMP